MGRSRGGDQGFCALQPMNGQITADPCRVESARSSSTPQDRSSGSARSGTGRWSTRTGSPSAWPTRSRADPRPAHSEDRCPAPGPASTGSWVGAPGSPSGATRLQDCLALGSGWAARRTTRIGLSSEEVPELDGAADGGDRAGRVGAATVRIRSFGRRPGEEPIGELTGVLFAQGLQREGAVRGESSSPVRPDAQEIGPGSGQQQQGGFSDAGGKELEQFEQAGIRPVKILEQQHRGWRAASGIRT
jgi:hypothetical protein